MSSLSMSARLRIVAADIKIAHSIFALPFALLGSCMAATSGGEIRWPVYRRQLLLVVIAMVFARTFAMLANRILDREIDARNPRTAGRALPSGRLPLRDAVLALAGCGALFVVTCAGFVEPDGNWWPLALSVPVLGWIGAYGLFKRFTAFCHFYLGSSLALSPIAAAIAVDPSALAQPALWMLAAMVLLWVAGFDVIYALQDVESDRADGLHSLPSRLGDRRALLVSRVAHAGAVALLVGAAAVDDRLGPVFAAAIVLVAALLVVEHATVSRWGRSRMALTFFTLNGVIACMLGAAGIVSILGG